MAQVVEQLLCKHKVQSSNPQTNKRKRQKCALKAVYCGTIHNSQVMETAKMPQH
jgi:hypothetical protein